MAAHNHVMRKYGHLEKKMEDIKSLAGKGAWVMMQRSFKEEIKDETLKKEMTKDFIDYYSKNIANQSIPVNGIIDFLKTADQRTGAENVEELLRRIRSGAGKMGGDIGNAVSGAQMNENVRLLGKSLVGSTLLNILQFQVSPETILSRGAGVVPNNNLALLFNSPTLREFKFSWKMSPRSKEEAIRVNNILRFFKQGMAPKKGITSNSRSGGGSYFLGTPNIFDLSFKTARTKNSFWEILDRNDSVMRIKTCACTGAAVNYTPEGMWNAYEKGQPVAITLTLRFNELEPIFDTDYDDNYFNYDPQRTDLLPVPMDAVGY